MNIRNLQKLVCQFRDERDWQQFHNPKDVALSLSLEAAEYLEHFQWKSENELGDYCDSAKEELGEELADCLYWVLLASHDLGIDLERSFVKKMKSNREKYPVSKAKGKKDKYDSL